MKRYSVESFDPYDMEEDKNGNWVDVDDALAAVAQERAEWAKVEELARQCAEWHAQDGDECGQVARELLRLLQTKQNAA